MEKFLEYKDFLLGLVRRFGRLRPAKAPADLADRVLSQIHQGADLTRQWDWDLPPTLALSGALAVFCVALWQGGDPGRQQQEARILSFSADKTVIRPDDVVTLSWDVANSKKVFIRGPHGTLVDMGEARMMSVHLNKPGDYEFALIAVGDDGKSVSRSLH